MTLRPTTYLVFNAIISIFIDGLENKELMYLTLEFHHKLI